MWPPPIVHKQQGTPNKILRPCNGRLSPCPCFLLADSGTARSPRTHPLSLQVCPMKPLPWLPRPWGHKRAWLQGQHLTVHAAPSRMTFACSGPMSTPHQLAPLVTDTGGCCVYSQGPPCMHRTPLLCTIHRRPQDALRASCCGVGAHPMSSNPFGCSGKNPRPCWKVTTEGHAAWVCAVSTRNRAGRSSAVAEEVELEGEAQPHLQREHHSQQPDGPGRGKGGRHSRGRVARSGEKKGDNGKDRTCGYEQHWQNPGTAGA